MPDSIEDQVIDFYESLYEQIFSEPFRPHIPDRLKRNTVLRQIQESADAASQSLTRFFINEQLAETEVANILEGLTQLREALKLEDISNPNITPESTVERLLNDLPCPRAVRRARLDAIYRIAMHSVVQGLTQVGPVMSEWQNIEFSSTFELPRRVIEKLNTISEQLNALNPTGQTAEDDRFELNYRDYLLQRFHRVEAGTVRMTINMDVDLRELFVMPRVLVRPQREGKDGAGAIDPTAPMKLEEARKFISSGIEFSEAIETEKKKKKSDGIQALNQVKRVLRNVIIGLPGSGKSTFLEWLQLKLAAVEQMLVMGEGQAIPLLLRVRELNPKKLPTGRALIERATASKDRAALMPKGWIERQMKAGRVLFLLDGLDETEPELCSKYLLPWLAKLCEEYPDCGYLISSRPVGYPPGALRPLNFIECDLLNFGKKEVTDYVKHWNTAIRLAQKQPRKEALQEGAADAEKMVADFQGHPYISNLAHNPLMLSAICLVNYFERGELPKDRAVLYRLCVEGLLHHWDQRRGIHSEYTLEEKLRTCREVALAMQADDRAEYEAPRVQKIFSDVLGDAARGEKLFEHIRYRTGLLIERRAGMFAFAHLTFQEYLAAQAVDEGNLGNIDVERLVNEHNDGRWKEVIALYCGLASANAARNVIEQLIEQPDTKELSQVLAESYLSSGPKLAQNDKLRQKILERIAITYKTWPSQLSRFPAQEVAPIANRFVGTIDIEDNVSEAYSWLYDHPQFIDETSLVKRLQHWQQMQPGQISELIYIIYGYGTPDVKAKIATDISLYKSPGPNFNEFVNYNSQAEVALNALLQSSQSSLYSSDIEIPLLQILRALSALKFDVSTYIYLFLPRYIADLGRIAIPQDDIRFELATLARQWIAKLSSKKERPKELINNLSSWADSLELKAAKPKRPAKSKIKSASKATSKRTTKKTSEGDDET